MALRIIFEIKCRYKLLNTRNWQAFVNFAKKYSMVNCGLTSVWFECDQNPFVGIESTSHACAR